MSENAIGLKHETPVAKHWSRLGCKSHASWKEDQKEFVHSSLCNGKEQAMMLALIQHFVTSVIKAFHALWDEQSSYLISYIAICILGAHIQGPVGTYIYSSHA